MAEPDAPGPVQDPATRADVKRLHAAGKGRNAIAAELGLSNSTVTRIAKALGLDFSREQTATAVRARSVDLSAGRLRLAEKMLAAAEELLDSRSEPYTVFAFGGRENDYNEHELDHPPVEAIKTIVSTAGIAFDKVTKFLDLSDDGEKDAQSLLRDLGKALGIGGIEAETTNADS